MDRTFVDDHRYIEKLFSLPHLTSNNVTSEQVAYLQKQNFSIVFFEATDKKIPSIKKTKINREIFARDI